MQSWYLDFNRWVGNGQCYILEEGFSNFEKVVPQEIFYPCLNSWLDDEKNLKHTKDLRWSDDPIPHERKLTGFRSTVMIKRIENASTQGVQFIEDIRSMESIYGLTGTFSFATRYLDYE